jgi:hypothetical protein
MSKMSYLEMARGMNGVGKACNMKGQMTKAKSSEKLLEWSGKDMQYEMPND